jgi:hypothetical protein
MLAVNNREACNWSSYLLICGNGRAMLPNLIDNAFHFYLHRLVKQKSNYITRRKLLIMTFHTINVTNCDKCFNFIELSNTITDHAYKNNYTYSIKRLLITSPTLITCTDLYIYNPLICHENLLNYYFKRLNV